MAVPATTLVFAALVPLIAWRLYSRVRRLIGRQRSRAWRHWTAAVMFPLLALLLALAAAGNPLALGMLAGGLAIGAGLGLWGLRLTRFERTAEGFFYTPSAHIGIALSLLLAARIAWRLFEVRTAFPAAGGGQDFARSPFTLAVIGTLAGYYATYAVGLIRWRRSAARHEAG
ncbi:MAG TPA: hypothetical protein VHQ02_16005 [Usitatibacter sp.]|jgi:cytochrome b561|nr:hypothetical protein [Usitatibacter sp.]